MGPTGKGVQALARELAVQWWFAETERGREMPALLLADLYEEHAGRFAPDPPQLRTRFDVPTLLTVLRCLGGRAGRALLANRIDGQLARRAGALWSSRSASFRTLPEGMAGPDTVWYPSRREGYAHVLASFRAHRPEYPWRYHRHCCTQRHCRWLIEQVSMGRDAPCDAWHSGRWLRQELWQVLTGEWLAEALFNGVGNTPLAGTTAVE